MEENIHRDIKKIVYSRELEDILIKIKKKDKTLFKRVENQIIKILCEPNIGKPPLYIKNPQDSYQWLINKKPIARAGTSIFIYKF